MSKEAVLELTGAKACFLDLQAKAAVPGVDLALLEAALSPTKY